MTRRKNKTVGSGITTYRREETLLDAPHRQSFLRGEPVPADLAKTTARPFVNVRWEIETTCKEVFSKSDLPDPFALLSPDGTAADSSWAEVAQSDLQQIKGMLDDYLPCCLFHCPEEDHSDLWYAARLATVLIQLDIEQAKARAHIGTREESVLIAAHLGLELGRLENEYRLKSDHETNAKRGESSTIGASAGGKATAKVRSKKTQQVLAAMASRIKDGDKIANAARLTYKIDGFGSSQAANRKLWSRHQQDKK